MYDSETVELALLALVEGLAKVEAAELCGASRGVVGHWAAARRAADIGRRAVIPASVGRDGASPAREAPRTRRRLRRRR